MSKLTTFLKNNELIAWVLSLPVALLMTQLAAIVGGEDQATTAREQTALVIVAGAGIVLSGLFALFAKRDVQQRRRMWGMVALGIQTAAFIVYMAASGIAKPEATVDDIAIKTDERTGTLTVSVKAADLRGKQRLSVKAVWADRDHTKTRGHKRGVATDEFTVAPVAETTRLQVIGFVTRVKGAGALPSGLTCGDYDACADLSTTLSSPPPDLSAVVKGRNVTVSVPRNRAAPDRLVVLVLVGGREIFKDNPLVTRRPYRATVALPAAQAGATDRVCVVATYQVERLRGCAAARGVSRKVLSVQP